MNVILTIVVSLMQVISTSNSISVAILSIYAMIFSCILCCYEMHTKLVAMVIVDYVRWALPAEPARARLHPVRGCH